MERIRRMVTGLRKNPPVVVPLILVAVLYAIFHRTTQQFFDESLPIAAFPAQAHFATRFLPTRIVPPIRIALYQNYLTHSYFAFRSLRFS